jgi:hypothetical protein
MRRRLRIAVKPGAADRGGLAFPSRAVASSSLARLPRNAPRSKQFLLDTILTFARESVIKLAGGTEYYHLMLQPI